MTQSAKSFNRFRTVVAAASLAGGMFAAQAHAVLIASHDFGTSGEVNGTGGGTGFAGNWTGVDAVTQLAAAPTQFYYQVVGGGRVEPNGVLQLTGNNDNAATRALAVPQTGDVYFSYLTSFETGGINQNDFAVWYFNDGLVASNPAMGWRGDANTSTATNPDLMARTNAGGESHAPDNAAVGQTLLVVGRVSKSGAGNYDRYSIWVNPAAGDFSTPEATSTVVSGTNTLSSINLRGANIDGGDRVIFGSLKLGTTWADVVPVVQAQQVTLNAVADAYVQRGDTNTNDTTTFGTTNPNFLEVKYAVAQTDMNFDRKTYLRFDTANMDLDSFSTASLKLTNAGPAGVVANPNRVWTFQLFGLNDDAVLDGGELGQNWAENAITWNNAPANVLNDGQALDLTEATLLTTFDIVGGGVSGDEYLITDPNILAFLKNDTDGFVSFILTRLTQEPSGDSVVHRFRSSENTLGGGPQLVLQVITPEPSVTLLSLIGASGLMFRRRRMG